MCGITGVAATRPVSDRTYLAVCRDVMLHRGPDDAGEWWSPDGRVGLAHRRLAIIDLSAAGHQPMEDAEGQTVIVFNGEIYNFRELRDVLAAKGRAFSSASDTEVILAAYREWGPHFLTRLNGMFALALFDARQGVLLLARDRAGEKPLFYSLRDGVLRFASELKALMADPSFPRRIDPAALDCYLALGFVPGEMCMLRDAKKLPPAHFMTFELGTGKAHVERYWQLPQLAIEHAGAASIPDLLDELEPLLEDAVRRQLVASDVPVGVLLSGGVDSSLVTAMAARASSHVKTFTVRFPGHPAFDETHHARLIARHFGTDHVELSAADATVDLLPMLAAQFDEPIVDSSMIPTFLLSKLVREHCTVALGGDGGDELFGGYPWHSHAARLEGWFGPVPRLIRSAAARLGEAVLPVGFRGRNLLQTLDVDFGAGIPNFTGHFSRGARTALMASRAPWPLVAERIRDGRISAGRDVVQRSTRTDFENFLVEDILVKVDRASMLNSLELRAPLLDYRVIEFAYRKVPPHLKATAKTRKILLKELCARVLPPEFDRDRKQGFDIPLAAWLRGGPWLDFFRKLLIEENDGFFDSRFVSDLLGGQLKGRSNSERLFSLALFELWRRHYGAHL